MLFHPLSSTITGLIYVEIRLVLLDARLNGVLIWFWDGLAFFEAINFNRSEFPLESCLLFLRLFR